MSKKSLGIALLISLLLSFPANAYIGPGAGFAILGSFMVFFFAIIAAILSVLIFPVRFVIRFIQVKKQGNKPFVKRVIVLGLDGLDPMLAEKWMAEGKLPNFKKLSEQGTFQRLKTSLPAMSPVAWSCFATGVNPGKHNIFDFLTPDRNSYLPVLSSTRIRDPQKTLKLGKYLIPLKKPEIQLLRKSRTFWKILGDHWIFSHIIRVPITFPPEKFYGAMLSAMCVPDLRGSQGSFTFWRAESAGGKHTGGLELTLEKSGNNWKGYLPGPENTLSKNREELRINFELRPEKKGGFLMVLPDRKVRLGEKKYSEWIRFKFNAGLGIKVSGLGKFLLIKGGESPELYLIVLKDADLSGFGLVFSGNMVIWRDSVIIELTDFSTFEQLKQEFPLIVQALDQAIPATHILPPILGYPKDKTYLFLLLIAWTNRCSASVLKIMAWRQISLKVTT